MTFNLFVQQARPRDAFPVLISLLALHAAPYNLVRKCTSLSPINHIKSATVFCDLMELLGYLHFPAQNSIESYANLRTHFQQDALHRVPWLPFTFVDISDLRMRIILQHCRCFPLATVGVKRFIYWMFAAPLCTCCSIDRFLDFAGVFVSMGSTNYLNFSLIGWQTHTSY